jgi:hypothetical protein
MRGKLRIAIGRGASIRKTSQRAVSVSSPTADTTTFNQGTTLVGTDAYANSVFYAGNEDGMIQQLARDSSVCHQPAGRISAGHIAETGQCRGLRRNEGDGITIRTITPAGKRSILKQSACLSLVVHDLDGIVYEGQSRGRRALDDRVFIAHRPVAGEVTPTVDIALWHDGTIPVAESRASRYIDGRGYSWNGIHTPLGIRAKEAVVVLYRA